MKTNLDRIASGLLQGHRHFCYKEVTRRFIQKNYHNSNTTTHFNRKAKFAQKNFANKQDNCETYDYLKHNIAYEIADRISDVNRDFSLSLDFGCGAGHILHQLTADDSIHMLLQGDASHEAVNRIPYGEIPNDLNVFDEEGILPYKKNVFDLVCSNLSLHWVNNIPETFHQVLRILRPDGCFLGAVFGGDTLYELRCSLQLAEQERFGGMASHVSPFLQGHDLANLMTNAGFNLVTLDLDSIQINYPTMFELMEDLKGMGENNALHSISPLNRDILLASGSIYQSSYANDDGTVPATFQILYFIGWKPDKSQPKPLQRGSTPKGFSIKQEIEK